MVCPNIQTMLANLVSWSPVTCSKKNDRLPRPHFLRGINSTASWTRGLRAAWRVSSFLEKLVPVLKQDPLVLSLFTSEFYFSKNPKLNHF